MNTPDFARVLPVDREPSPGTLEQLNQRLKKTLVVNADIIADMTGRVGQREKVSAQSNFDRILWQLGMIESLKAEKAHAAISEGATWDQAAEQELNLSAIEAATRLDSWTQETLGDPRQDEDHASTVFRGHAEDLQRMLIDEASRVSA